MAKQKPPISVPWPQLAAMAQDLKAGVLQRIVKAATRRALIKWRDRFIPLRFSKSAHSIYGFSNRSVSYTKRHLRWSKYVTKGDLPDYVWQGRFRDTLLKRKPKYLADDPSGVGYRFSIYGGVINALKNKSGYKAEVTSIERITETVKPHTRKGRPVSGHSRTGYRRTWKISASPRTYAQEWMLRDNEMATAKEMVNNEIRVALSTKGMINQKTGRFRDRFLREELLNK